MNVNDPILNQLRDLDAAPFTTLTDDQQARAEASKEGILATKPVRKEPLPLPGHTRKRRTRTRSRVAWGVGLLAVTGSAVAALVFAATTHLGAPTPIVGTTPDGGSTPSQVGNNAQPQLTEAEAVAGCIEAWRPDPTVQATEQYESFYINDEAITNVVEGEWQITLVPQPRVNAEWNLYCTSTGGVVTVYTNGYEDWPTLAPTQTVTVGDTTLLAAIQEPDVAMESRVEGTLHLSDAGCWFLDDGNYRTLLQFPYGSTLASGGNGIVIPGLGTVHAGDVIRGIGGTDSAPADTPATCGGPAQPMMYWQSAAE